MRSSSLRGEEGGSSGQTFMPDYLASIVVFGILVSIFLASWNSVLDSSTEFETEDRMRIRAGRTTAFLVSTPGYPENWESPDKEVRIPGFASPDHLLQGDKLKAFRNLTYQEQREALLARNFFLEISTVGNEYLGRSPVALIVEEGSQLSSVELVEVMNGSDTTWDLYWPSTKSESKLESLTAREVYNYSDQGSVMLEDLIENASRGDYGSIVAEDANIGTGEIDNEDSLRNFVEGGGNYIHTGQKGSFVRDVFNLSEASIGGSGVGEAVEIDPLLNSSIGKGEKVEFEQEVMAFRNPDTVFVNDTGSPYECLSCGWKIGSGQLYLTQDTRSEGGSLISFTSGDSFGGIYQYGRYYSDAETVIPFTRTVQVNISGKIRTAKLRYIVWK